MIHKVTVRIAALGLFAFASAGFAQSPGVPSKAPDMKPTADERKDPAPLKLDTDLDDDGIIDAVKTLPVMQSAGTSDESKAGEASQGNFKTTFAKEQPRKKRSAGQSCMDYMMMSPEQKDRVNQKIQSRTLGAFGSRPCDPFVSDMIDRPFDDEYIEVPLKPVGSVVLRSE